MTTGARNTKDAADEREFIDFVQSTERTDEQIRRKIDSMNVSADAKALLNNLLSASTKVGEVALRIGRKILDFVLTAVQTFPQLTFAALLGLVFAALFAMIPILGTLLSAIVTPLALALGIGLGVKAEIDSGDLHERIKQFASTFAPLKS